MNFLSLVIDKCTACDFNKAESTEINLKSLETIREKQEKSNNEKMKITSNDNLIDKKVKNSNSNYNFLSSNIHNQELISDNVFLMKAPHTLQSNSNINVNVQSLIKSGTPVFPVNEMSSIINIDMDKNDALYSKNTNSKAMFPEGFRNKNSNVNSNYTITNVNMRNSNSNSNNNHSQKNSNTILNSFLTNDENNYQNKINNEINMYNNNNNYDISEVTNLNNNRNSLNSSNNNAYSNFKNINFQMSNKISNIDRVETSNFNNNNNNFNNTENNNSRKVSDFEKNDTIENNRFFRKSELIENIKDINLLELVNNRNYLVIKDMSGNLFNTNNNVVNSNKGVQMNKNDKNSYNLNSCYLKVSNKEVQLVYNNNELNNCKSNEFALNKTSSINTNNNVVNTLKECNTLISRTNTYKKIDDNTVIFGFKSAKVSVASSQNQLDIGYYNKVKQPNNRVDYYLNDGDISSNNKYNQLFKIVYNVPCK